MAKRKEQHEKEANHERWLITYSDLITLLMIFFVVMYAMSNVDAQKFRAVGGFSLQCAGRSVGQDTEFFRPFFYRGG